MKNISEFIKEADEKTLVLIDELGAGTDPIEGSALGIGILEYLKEKGAWVFITTHHTPIKLYATTSEYYVPASVLFDKDTLKPLYRIAYNVVGESMAFYIAQKYGIPEKVIEVAKKHIGEFGEKYIEAMEKLSEKVKKYEEEYAKIENLRKELEEERKKLEELKKEYEEAKRKAWKEVYKEAREYLRKLSYEAEEKMKKLKEKKEMEKFLKEKREEIEKLAPSEEEEIKVGDTVEFMGKRGKVIEVKNGKAFVLLDKIKMWVNKRELKKVKAEESGVKKEIPQIITPKNTINLIGKDVESAISELEKFIEEAYASGLSTVRVIHGIGSGRLKEAVREYLSKSDKVKFFRDAYPKEGGSGVTVVYLNYEER